MDSEQVFLKVFLIVLCLIGYRLYNQFHHKIIDFMERLLDFIESILEVLGTPIVALYMLIRNKIVSKTGTWFYNLKLSQYVDHHPVLGSPAAVWTLALSLLYLTIMLTISAFTHGIGDFLLELLYVMPVGFFVQLATEGVDFQLIGLISGGMTSFLTAMLFEKCMENSCTGKNVLRQIIKFMYYVILTAVACSLSLHLSGLWELLATVGVSVFNYMHVIFNGADQTFLGVLKMIGSGLVILPLAYIGILLLLIAIQEYVEIIGHSLLAMLLLGGCLLLCYTFLPDAFLDSKLGDVTAFLLLFGIMVICDYRRVCAGLSACK